ncbi:MAG TPA: hypothetical protein VN666_15935 [Nitrospira sp.]|nr:hypothetical protein [Nitrospira sp.]
MDMLVGEQRGVALLTIMLLALILTVLGIAAINVSGWERRVAGMSATADASAAAAESCVGTSVNVIKQAIDSTISQFAFPAAVLSNAVPPGPVPVTNASTLFSEIKGQPLPSNAPSENNPDVPTGPSAAPNIVLNINNYTVAGDIDRMWAKQNVGSGGQSSAGYEGYGAGSQGGATYVYKVDCVATNVMTGATSRITAVYSCVLGGGGCEAKTFGP